MMSSNQWYIDLYMASGAFPFERIRIWHDDKTTFVLVHISSYAFFSKDSRKAKKKNSGKHYQPISTFMSSQRPMVG